MVPGSILHMTSDLDTRRSAGDRSRAFAYYRDFWPGMIGYVVILAAVLRWGDLDGDSPWRFVWSLLPVLPAVWTVRAVLRHIRRIDDYQRLLLLEGLAVGFAVAMVTAVTVGFLGIAHLPMRLAPWVIYGAGMLGWAVASAFVQQR